jgi:hypothetical protein
MKLRKAVSDFLITVDEFEQKQKALTKSSIQRGAVT